MSIASIRSEGDLEVVVLHETHSALASIVNLELYQIGGEPPDETALFHNTVCFNLFLILTVELFAEGARSAFINSKYQNLSLVGGVKWLIARHPSEAKASGLADASSALESWLAREAPLSFWCGELGVQVEFPMVNEQLISFGANTAKHHLLRLSTLLSKLEGLCKHHGYTFTPQELVAVLDSMVEEVRSRLTYHATYLLELLGNYFLGLNRLISRRHNVWKTSGVNEIAVPTGVTSDVFRNLYGAVLVFKHYDENRILTATPQTTKYLKMRYQ